ncbi:MAG: BREX-1 system adenine-specific DNA-methyltransferase PglX, partial [Ruminococcus flavefaciens]|nr:BREX-1 system adenine-specific DNA-methyltransferase PglX [Ruminococcus flavefaciens]
MNKTAIRNFAIWARKQLIEDTKQVCMEKGITDKEILEPLSSSASDIQFFDIGTGKEARVTKDEIPLRDELIKKIQEKAKETDYASAYAYIVEKVAYTWFNRIIAIRFMEVNDYLPSEIRVLSSTQEGKN